MKTNSEGSHVRGERLFRFFLRLYSRPFRERFGDELVYCFRRTV